MPALSSTMTEGRHEASLPGRIQGLGVGMRAGLLNCMPSCLPAWGSCTLTDCILWFGQLGHTHCPADTVAAART